MPVNPLNNLQERVKPFSKDKELGASKLIVLVFILILLIAVSLVIFYFYTVNKNTTSDTIQNPESVGNIESDAEIEEYIDQFKKEEWNPLEFPATGDVLRVIDDQDKIVEIKFSWPIEIVDKIVEVKLLCDETDYSLATPDYPPGEAPEDAKPESISSAKFIELLKESIVVISGFCTDKECKVIDKGCILRVL